MLADNINMEVCKNTLNDFKYTSQFFRSYVESLYLFYELPGFVSSAVLPNVHNLSFCIASVTVSGTSKCYAEWLMSHDNSDLPNVAA